MSRPPPFGKASSGPSPPSGEAPHPSRYRHMPGHPDAERKLRRQRARGTDHRSRRAWTRLLHDDEPPAVYRRSDPDLPEASHLLRPRLSRQRGTCASLNPPSPSAYHVPAMTEYATGQTVRTLVPIEDEYGRERIPERVQARVLGFVGPRIILEWDDENGERVDAVADPWELRRVTPRMVR